MCLIVYSPTGELIEPDVFVCALEANPDGIGIMSSRGVKRFLGRTAATRAWSYLCQLAAARIPYGVHFRMATHGDVIRENCHPFYVPNSDALVMHNGILSFTAEFATPARSDTAIFVDCYMPGAPGPEVPNYKRYYRCIGRTIGVENRLLIFHTLTESFTICNESSGEWIGQHWYSNTYSLPWGLPVGIDGMYESGGPGGMDYWERKAAEGLEEWMLYHEGRWREGQNLDERVEGMWEQLRYRDD